MQQETTSSTPSRHFVAHMCVDTTATTTTMHQSHTGTDLRDLGLVQLQVQRSADEGENFERCTLQLSSRAPLDLCEEVNGANQCEGSTPH